MSRVNNVICVMAALVFGALSTGAKAQEARNVEAITPSRPAAADSAVAVDKECIEANGANVCWLNFTDGTRCVVANNANGGDSSTAINCHFSTPMERLHRMPKD